MSDASSNGCPYADRSPAVGATAALFEYAPRPIAAVRGTDSPNIQVVNRAYLEQFDGRCLEDTDRGTFPCRAELGGTERAVVRTAATGTAASDAIVRRTASGRRRFVIRAFPATRADVTAYLQYRDVTERQIRDQQLAVLQRVLRHDLRNDLTVLLGYAQTIAETADDPDVSAAAETMIEAADDLRTVATSAGRMQCVTGTPTPAPLDDVIARVRRAIPSGIDGSLKVDGPIASNAVDSRIGIALEELCRTLTKQGCCSEIFLDADVDDDRVTLAIDADGPLDEQERAALQGRDETQLRHATGIAPWIARWAVRAAGGRLHVRSADASTSIAITAPVLDVAAASDDARTAGIEH